MSNVLKNQGISLVLDAVNPFKVYMPGETVSGNVLCDLEAFPAKGMYIQICTIISW